MFLKICSLRLLPIRPASHNQKRHQAHSYPSAPFPCQRENLYRTVQSGQPRVRAAIKSWSVSKSGLRKSVTLPDRNTLVNSCPGNVALVCVRTTVTVFYMVNLPIYPNNRISEFLFLGNMFNTSKYNSRL